MALWLEAPDRQAVTALAERRRARAHLEVWINGAGIFVACPVLEAMAEDWHRIIAVNLTGTFYGLASVHRFVPKT